MEKSRFLELTEAIKTGERVRMLFDLLVDIIGGNEGITRGQFFEAMKARIDAESAAHRELAEAANASMKTTGFQEVTDNQENGVSVSN